MPSDWQRTTIGAQLTLQRGFNITKAQQRPGTVPVVSSGGISSFHDTAAVHGPGVVLGRKGTIGTVFYLPCDFWPHDTTLWVKDFHGNDPRFAYYFFLSISRDLAALDVGTANPALNRNHVHPTSIRWPTLDEQRAIAEALAALDDKIELNQQTNRTLEAMVQALFKSWFVDLDPVVAKAAGRQPFGMDAATAELFADRFAESALGLIPRGWSVGKLKDAAVLSYGKSLPESRRVPGDVAVFGSDGPIGWHAMPLVKGPGIIVGRKGNAGCVKWSESDFFPIDTTYFVEPTASAYPIRFLYPLLQSMKLQDVSGDSAVPGLNRELLHTR